LGSRLSAAATRLLLQSLRSFFFLFQVGSQTFTLFLLGLLLAESDAFLPVGVVNGQVKELSDGFRLDSPYPVDKGLARGTTWKAVVR
jgi:hypothetical protein